MCSTQRATQKFKGTTHLQIKQYQIPRPKRVQQSNSKRFNRNFSTWSCLAEISEWSVENNITTTTTTKIVYFICKQTLTHSKHTYTHTYKYVYIVRHCFCFSFSLKQCLLHLIWRFFPHLYRRDTYHLYVYTYAYTNTYIFRFIHSYE